MKRLILLLCFVTGISLAANAQTAQKTPEQRAHHMTKVLQKRLDLSPGQSQQVNTIFLVQVARMDSLRTHLSDDKKLNRLSAHTIILTSQKNIMGVLNDTQKQQFTEWENRAKEKRAAKRDTALVKG
jgi:hypothetical protein